MNFCVIIPVFNHGDTLAGIVDRLSACQLPVIVVDDGSDSRTKALIADPVSRFGAQLITLPTNGGKGAAVQAGLKAAWKQGRTHAIQVDADGQHDLDDLNKFLHAARAHPEALISGAPLFDASVPKSRLYGRLITHFWVCVETLSTKTSDAMCGFRVYPLKSTIELIESRQLGRRMDFDIEILVRLNWKGVQLVGVPTQVTYPDQGVSHFRLWQDNWVITRMHTRLFFGMLWRLPILVIRKFGVGRSHWSTLAERGGSLGLKILFGAYNMFGRRVFTVLLYPVIGYFYVTSPQARRASREYLDRVERALELAGNHSGKRLSSFKHFLSFGDSILDKTAMWAGRADMGDVRYVGPSSYDDVVALGQGGNFHRFSSRELGSPASIWRERSGIQGKCPRFHSPLAEIHEISRASLP